MPRRLPEPLGIPRGGASPLPTALETHGFDRWIATRLMRVLGSPPVGVVLWDGHEAYAPPDAVARLRVHDRAALFGLVLRPGLAFGDLYSVGRIEIEGDLPQALVAVYRATLASARAHPRLTALRRIAYGSAPSLGRARKNIHHHYDLGNDFYTLWLDRDALQYTCAYYPVASLTLEQAQRAKMDHVCRKLWLSPGERVIEAGCGWGGFALHMARHYGVEVRAFNISHEQIVYARQWAAREGLDDRVEFVEDDYRNITTPCDVFVSVGMLEHVGPGNYSELGRVIDRCLAQGGRGLIHSIGRDRPAPLNAWIRKRIFPGAHPPTLREMADVFESGGFSVLDVENLRLHYEETLRAWLSRYEESLERVRTMFDDRFARAWRLYLAGSIAGFSTGSLQLFQVLFARSGVNAVPRSRAHLYDGDRVRIHAEAV